MKKFLLFSGLLFIAFSASAQSKTDSLLKVCENAPENKKAALYLELSFNSRNDSSISNLFTRKAYQLAIQNEQVPLQAKSFYYLGEMSYYSRDYSGAIPHYENAIPIFEQLNDSSNLTNCYNSVGLCYHCLFQGDKAIEYFIKALRTCENDKEYTAKITSNIAMAHVKMNNYNDAITNYRKALSINKSIKDSLSIAINYNGLGNSYTDMNKPDSAIVNFRRAYNLFKTLKSTGYQAIALTNIANLYPNYPDSLDKAIDFYNQALIKFKELEWNQYEAEISQGMGIVYRNKGKFKEALSAFEESLRITDKYNRGLFLKRSNYHEMAETYKLTGDYKSALKYHELFVTYNDSMVQKEKYEQIISLEKKYETEKKENEIIKLNAKQELTDVELRKNKQLKQFGFIIASLLLVFILFVLIRYIDKIKLNKILEEKNRQIEQSENELRLLNAAKNKFFSIIAHDLKNPFHTVMGFSYLLSKDHERFSEAERKKFADDIYSSTNRIYRLLQNLLEWSKSQTGRLKFSPLEIEFQRVLDNSVSILRPLAEQKNICIQFDYSNELKLFADPTMLETILRNLINNAIKFTPEEGLITITAKQIENHVNISITDTGIGISAEDVENLFKIDSTVKRKGTNDEDGSGIGLILCKEFVKKNNGEIWVNSTLKKGSSFIFTIPAIS